MCNTNDGSSSANMSLARSKAFWVDKPSARRTVMRLWGTPSALRDVSRSLGSIGEDLSAPWRGKGYRFDYALLVQD